MIVHMNIKDEIPVSVIICPITLRVLLRLDGGLPNSGETSILSWNFRHQHFVFLEGPWQDKFSGKDVRRKTVFNIKSKKVLARLNVLELRKRR